MLFVWGVCVCMGVGCVWVCGVRVCGCGVRACVGCACVGACVRVCGLCVCAWVVKMKVSLIILILMKIKTIIIFNYIFRFN